jgi:hypothetical protein
MITKNMFGLVYKSQPYTNKSKHSRFVSDARVGTSGVNPSVVFGNKKGSFIETFKICLG